MTTLLPVFLITLLVSFVLTFHLTRPRTAKTSVVKRLNIIHRPVTSTDVAMIELNQDRQGMAERLSELLAHLQFSRHLSRLILYAGRADSVGFILLVSGALAVGVVLSTRFFTDSPLILLGLGAFGACLPYLWLRRTRNKRLKLFNEALPDAIELMARALRAGHSSGSSIEIIAEQSPMPLSEEFGRCFQQQKFGIPFRQAMIELGDRTPSRDLQFLITAILVQKETGGDLTHILDRATAVIRERVRIEGEVRSYTAQGRLTGWILAAFPLVMLVLINLMSPGYTHVLFADPLGHYLVDTGIAFMAIGAFLISRIVDVKV